MTAPADDTNVGGIVAHLRIDGGAEWARELEQAQRRAEALGRVSPHVRITSNADELQARHAALMAQLQAMGRLNPDVRIGTNTPTVIAELAAIRARMEALGAENTSLRFDLTEAQRQIELLRQRSGRQGGIAGRDFGAQFGRGLRETIAAIPDIELDADASDVDRQLQEVRAQLEELSKRRIGVDITAEHAMRSLAALQGELEALKAQAGDVDVRFNTTAAAARLARLRAQLGELKVTPDIDQGQFASRLAKAVREATAALPKIDVDADSTPAQRELAEIRAKMVALGEQKIGVDITAAEATAKLRALQGELDRLNRRARDDVRIRMDTAAASAKLAALQAQLNGLAVGKAAGSGGSLAAPVIIGAIIAAATTAGPIVAAATAGAVGLTGAVGAAALAYKGLKQNAEDETRTGLRLKGEIKGIGDELGRLETIAGNRAAPGVLGALGKIRAYLPSLDGPIAGLAMHLGNALNTGAGGLVSLLRTSTPLLNDMGGYAEHIADSFARWAASPEAKQFIEYARRELPEVARDVADVGKAFVDVATDMAPAGEAVLGFLGSTGRGIQKIHDFGKDAKGYLSGAVEEARRLGSYLNDPIAPHRGPSKKPVDPNIEARASQAAQAQQLVEEWTRRAAAATEAEADALERVRNQYGLSENQAKAHAAMLGVAAGSHRDMAAAVREVMEAERSATATQSAYLSGLATFAGSSGTAADRAAFIGATLKASNGDALGYAGSMATAATANQAFVTSFDAARTTARDTKRVFNDARDGVVDLTKGTINYKNAAAGPLISGLQAMQDAAMKAAGATYQHELATQGAAKASEHAVEVYRAQTAGALVEEAKHLGITEKEARGLAKTYFSMPKDITTKVKAIGTDPVVTVLNKIGEQLSYLTGRAWGPSIDAKTVQARAKIAALQAQINAIRQGKPTGIAADTELAKRRLASLQGQIDALRGKTVTVTINSVGRAVHDAVNSIPGGRPPGRATGGSLPEGYSTINERGWELLHKRGSDVQVIPHELARQMLPQGPSVPAFASGTGGAFVGVYAPSTISPSTVAAVQKASRAKAKKQKEVILTLRATAGNGAAWGIAQYVKGQIPSTVAAMRLLDSAVDSAFSLKGLRAKVAGYRTELDKLRDLQKSLASDVGGKLSEGADPSQFGSIQQYTAYLQAKAAQNNRYRAQVAKLDANRAIPDDLLAQFAAGGPGAILDSFAGASRRDIAALVRASAGFDASVAGGRRQAAAIYGPAIAKDTANLNRALAQSARTEAAMINATLKLAQILNKPVTIKLDGKTVATTKFVHDELQGVLNGLRNVLVTGRLPG